MDIPTSIFKSYDIRGVYPEELNEEMVRHIGAAYAQMIRQETGIARPKIVVGGDMRISTPSLKKALITGLILHGVEVVDVGLVSTPTFYFAVAFYKYDGGVQVSASHNPKQYNGLKMVRAGAAPIGKGNGMEEIERLSHLQLPPTVPPGEVSSRKGILEDLMKAEVSDVKVSDIKPLTVVVDGANAMGSLDLEAIFHGLPVKLVKLNFELDGNFPSHPADPLDPENLEQLSAAVVEHQADLGIAPDGDGDRYFFLDEKGVVIRQEILRGIMAQIALKEHPGATVCYDIRPGKITKDLIEQAGGKAIVTRVGHSHIKKAMLDAGAVFGGESSGHYFYQFPFGTFEAPAPLVLKFLVWVSQQDKPLSEAMRLYREKYSHSGEINSKVADVRAALARIKEKYADANISDLDGLSIEYPDFWFNVRGSNTEPLIRLNLEATSQQLMEEKRDEALEIIRQA